jgi:alpha-glucosidase (family GH31 glycosyl hydrolase)
MGKRSDGETIKDLKLRIFPSENKTSFTLFEDDGETNQYLSGGIKETLVTQQIQNQQIEITIEPTTKPDENRKVVLEVCGVSIDTINRIQVNGVELPSSQWSKSGPNRVAIVTDFMPESVKKYFVIDIKPH